MAREIGILAGVLADFCLTKEDGVVADDSIEHPPPDAYNRVTNPERYRVLHDAGHDLLERLERDYVVQRRESAALDPDLTSRVAVQTVVRLEPPSGQGAPLTVAFTEFPGLLVRFGCWHKEAFPRCGCDACDESPEKLITDLGKKVECLVAGGFREQLQTRRLRRSVLLSDFTGEGWRQSSEAFLERRDPRWLGPPGEANWPGWTRR